MAEGRVINVRGNLGRQPIQKKSFALPPFLGTNPLLLKAALNSGGVKSPPERENICPLPSAQTLIHLTSHRRYWENAQLQD